MNKTIPQGTYHLKEDLKLHSLAGNESYTEEINFTVDNISFLKFMISCLKGASQTHFHLIYKNNDYEYDTFVCSVKNTNNSVLSSEWINSETIKKPKMITFEADTSVSEKFYFWFQNNVIPSTNIVETKIKSIIQKITDTTGTEYANLTDAVEDLISKVEEINDGT